MIRGIFGDLSANGERQRAAEARAGKPVNAMMQFPQLQLTDSERAVLTGHLRDSASMVESQYKTGGKVERTERIIDILNVIAEAAGNPRPVNISVNLDSVQAGIIRKVLQASRERAGDLRGVRDAISAVIATWEQTTRYDPRVEQARAHQSPAEASDEGGWRPVA